MHVLPFISLRHLEGDLHITNFSELLTLLIILFIGDSLLIETFNDLFFAERFSWEKNSLYSFDHSEVVARIYHSQAQSQNSFYCEILLHWFQDKRTLPHLDLWILEATASSQAQKSNENSLVKEWLFPIIFCFYYWV